MGYVAEIVHDLPDLPQFEFEVPGGLGEVVAQVLVRPGGASPWIGLFRSLGSSDTTRLEVWEGGEMLLVVAKGYGHFVRADDPRHRIELPVFPVRHTLRHASGVVVLGDFTHLCGVDGSGVLWVSPTLGSDWLESVKLDKDNVVGMGSVEETGGTAAFRIAIENGHTDTDWHGESS